MRYINLLIYSNQQGIRILRHVLFWLTDIFNWLLVISITGLVAKDVYIFLLTMPLAIATTYFMMYYLLPKFSQGQERSKLFFWIIGTLLALGLVLRLYKYYVLFPAFAPERQLDFDLWSLGRYIREVFSWMAVISLAITIKLIKNKTELQDKNEQLTAEKKTAELNFLKAQMHPHFLFNTLNTLYSETLQNSGKAEIIVLHLSSLLRFILEECNKPLITLDKEIKVILDYIELEKLRHGDRLQVNFSIARMNIHQSISPLIFLPFVENSVKHSLNNIRGPVVISISIESEGDRLSFVVENDYVKTTKTVNGYSSGKGITNIKRQLELLYAENYHLDIQQLEGKYRVALSVPLKQEEVHV